MIRTVWIFLFLCHFASARVFNMQDNKFGGYLNLNYGSSYVKSDFYKGESSATDFSKGFKTHTGGEFGFAYRMGYISWLFGMELINTGKVKGVASTSGATSYNYSSEISAVIPKVGAEIVFYETPASRYFAGVFFGTGSVSTKTSYSSLTIAPNSDFEIEGKGSATSINYGVGGEWHMNDNTTFIAGLSKRELNFNKLKYVEDVSSSFNGAHSKGDTILKSDGTNLKYDFSSLYFTIGLRFWLL